MMIFARVCPHMRGSPGCSTSEQAAASVCSASVVLVAVLAARRSMKAEWRRDVGAEVVWQQTAHSPSPHPRPPPSFGPTSGDSANAYGAARCTHATTLRVKRRLREGGTIGCGGRWMMARSMHTHTPSSRGIRKLLIFLSLCLACFQCCCFSGGTHSFSENQKFMAEEAWG